ncbi:hypothetical protein MFRU_020g00650 [Monilinia fructicola]|uniref:Granulins domain-containing protein n=1 Tax=Monilinia fructicola TaxID=38448 RepID=A0A5M9K6K7_MONFR|nr:hypothetical protein EYC84_004799 [Monilinia fructicola]KAG4028626.1 hypothetical protein MFRU_020g00650 [Monilinia fructicola]
MRSTNVILAILSLSPAIFALAAPKSPFLEVGLKGVEKDCQCSSIGSVCHKVSHINCCNGLSCEMTDNPNGDYGICRASDENRDNDDRCMCSMSGGVCHPKSDVNCCFGLFCDMTNNANGDYGKCRPSNESRNPLKKVEDDEDNCLVPGSTHCNLRGAPPCCSRSKCNEVGICEIIDDNDDGNEDMCLKPGALHCNYFGAKKCCPGSKCNKVGRSDSNTFMCEKSSDDTKQCLTPGSYHCNIPGMDCCPGASCKNIRGESFMCAKDSGNHDDDDDDFPFNNKKIFFSLNGKNILEEDCDREMCIEGGQMCHHRRQNSECPPAPCCPGFDCEYVDAHQESFCVSTKTPLEKSHPTAGQEIGFSKKNGLMAGKTSPLYTLKGMFQGFVEKMDKKHCLPHGETCMMHHDKCCHGLMCHSGKCMAAGKEDLKL